MATPANPPGGSPGQSGSGTPAGNPGGGRQRHLPLTLRMRSWSFLIKVLIAVVALGLVCWAGVKYLPGLVLDKKKPEDQFTNLDAAKKMVELVQEIAKLSAENTALRSSTSTGQAKADGLTRVPRVEAGGATNTIGGGTNQSLALTNDPTGALNLNTTNGIAVKVTADRDSNVRVYIRDNSNADKKSGLLEPDAIIKLDPSKDGRIDPTDGSYWITNKIGPGETTLYLVPSGWTARAENDYPKRFVQVVTDNDLDPDGKIMNSKSVMIRNKTESIIMDIIWQCFKIKEAGK